MGGMSSDLKPAQPQNAFLIVRVNEAVKLHLSHEPMTGVIGFAGTNTNRAAATKENHEASQPVLLWSMKNTHASLSVFARSNQRKSTARRKCVMASSDLTGTEYVGVRTVERAAMASIFMG